MVGANGASGSGGSGCLGWPWVLVFLALLALAGPPCRQLYREGVDRDQLWEEAHRLGGHAGSLEGGEERLDLSGTPTDEDQFARIVRLPGFRQVESVGLEDTRITDRSLELLASRQPLALLDVSGTKVTDEGLKSIARMRSLGQFSARGTAISDAGLRELINHAGTLSLRTVSLGDTRVTNAGVERLRKAFPEIRVDGKTAAKRSTKP